MDNEISQMTLCLYKFRQLVQVKVNRGVLGMAEV